MHTQIISSQASVSATLANVHQQKLFLDGSVAILFLGSLAVFSVLYKQHQRRSHQRRVQQLEKIWLLSCQKDVDQYP